MSEMQFETDDQNEFVRAAPSGGFDLSGKLVAWGLASSRQQAEYALIFIGVLCLLIAGYFFFSGGGSSAPPPLPQ